MWKNDSLDETQLKLLEHNIIAVGGDIDGSVAIYIREAILRLRAKGSPPIELQITSSGGDVNVGLDMYDLLKNYPGEITGIVYGYAKSMAAVILQACKKRVATEHSYILIHHISRKSIGLDDLRDPQKIAEIKADLEKRQTMIYSILTDKTKRSLEEIKEECSKERSVTAQEAKAFGLIDEII